MSRRGVVLRGVVHRAQAAARRAGWFMAHVAIQEADDQGLVVTRGDHVTDEEYARGGSA
jgi:hypothetical protein